MSIRTVTSFPDVNGPHLECDSGPVTWTATRALVGRSSQGTTVVVQPSRDRRRVRRFMLPWLVRCTGEVGSLERPENLVALDERNLGRLSRTGAFGARRSSEGLAFGPETIAIVRERIAATANGGVASGSLRAEATPQAGERCGSRPVRFKASR